MKWRKVCYRHDIIDGKISNSRHYYPKPTTVGYTRWLKIKWTADNSIELFEVPLEKLGKVVKEDPQRVVPSVNRIDHAPEDEYSLGGGAQAENF